MSNSEQPEPNQHERLRLSRRALLGGAGAGLAGFGLGFGASEIAQAVKGAPAAGALSYPFYGTHQSGITTPAQDRLHFAVFDVSEGTTRAELIELLQDWTIASEALTAGKEIGEYGASAQSYDAPPEDSGEAVGLPTAGLTITFGFGPSLFSTDSGQDRFGLASHKPRELEPLPHFPGDALEPAFTGGDICIQACANDPQVAVHAIRNLTRMAFGRAVLKWSQLGYGRTSSTSTGQKTERNLFGYKDGTNNIKAENADDTQAFVWVKSAGKSGWMNGGSYLVARRIRMNLETWDRASLREQDTVFGRNKAEGAPLSGGTEFTPADFTAKNSDGDLAIQPDSHMALAAPQNSEGIKMLRRGYNFVDGNDELGRLNAGLFFISFQNDPANFNFVQRKLAKHDRLNEYIRHVGSGVWAIPPGAQPGSFIGAPLFLA